MAPIDNQAMVAVGQGGMGMLQGMPPGPGGGTIPLSTLIEYIIQSTYHDLTVLSELLPRKTDMERKIEIVNFASRTRQLFVRLLAVVKWANSATKVDKCSNISNYLDQQAMYFVDTADMLAKMARVTLVRARLPSFSIPCAIDVLTTGTYPRLPSCIKEKIVPPDPITHQEKYQTLFRLNQIIEHRLVTMDLPKHMRKPKIQSGRVVFRVQHEFQVTLTLMGDGADIPWRLLDIEILVEDPETGAGKALVHSMQVYYLHQLVQARLMENDKPLDDLYNVLHAFCQSLQLEVLYTQAQRLINERLGNHIRVEEYLASKKLVLSYWRNQLRKENKTTSNQIFKLSIFVDEHNPARPLQISHFPQIQGSESIIVAQTIKTDNLSLEKLLVHTIQVRSLAKLKELEREFRLLVTGQCETRNLPSVLYVPVVQPCMTTEKLSITVDIQTGHFIASLCSKETALTQDVQTSLNGDRRDLRRHLTKLRLWLGMQRCKKSAQQVGALVYRSLPIVNISGHPLEKLSSSHLFIRLTKKNHYYLVVECQESRRRQITYNYYLLEATVCKNPDTNTGSNNTGSSTAPNATPSHDSGSTSSGQETGLSGEELSNVYLRATHMVQLDTYACTHSQQSRIFDMEEEDAASLNRKRKLLLGDPSEPPLKKQRESSYFVSDLTHILSLCEDHLPLMALSQELTSHAIHHTGQIIVDNGAGLGLRVISFPPVPGVSKWAMDDLNRCLVSFTFRIQRRLTRCLMLEAMFCRSPIMSTESRESGSVHRAYQVCDASEPEKIVTDMKDDIKSISILYEAVLVFSQTYKSDKFLQNEIEIRSFNYRRLILAYGPNKCYTCAIQYKPSDNQFHLTLGTVQSTSVSNFHTVMLSHLQRLINHTRSIAKLAHNLASTWPVLQSIGKLNACAMQGVNPRPSHTVPTFSVVPQSPEHLRVFFRQTYCLDIHCKSNRVISIRDGAYSMFESSKVVDACHPINGLRAFLAHFTDDAASIQARRRSTIEDDNPPSPLGMDMETFMASQQNTASPGAASQSRSSKSHDGTLRFQNPLTPSSNPCTPASPATSRGSNQVSGNMIRRGSFHEYTCTLLYRHI